MEGERGTGWSLVDSAISTSASCCCIWASPFSSGASMSCSGAGFGDGSVILRVSLW